MGVDTTLWPSNSAYLTACVNLASGIVNMSQDSLCHVQLPQLQSSTTGPTVIKHRRTLEDMFTTQKLDVTTPVLLRFEKTESQKNDSRKSAQQCIAASSTNYKVNGFADTDAVKSSTIGPAPLIKTSQMLGYDPEDGSMSAGLRTEQKLGFNHVRSPQVLFLDLEAILKKNTSNSQGIMAGSQKYCCCRPIPKQCQEGSSGPLRDLEVLCSWSLSGRR